MKPTIALFLGLVIVAAFASSAYATTQTYSLVSGIVHDSNDHSIGIPDANITVECLSNGNTTTTTSGTVGHYAAVIECPFGSNVEVNVTKGAHSGSSTGTIDIITGIPDLGGGTINIGVAAVDVSIPEFPTPLIPALLSIASFGLVSLRLR